MYQPFYKPIHVDFNLYLEIEQEYRFIDFENLPKPCLGTPATAYQYEYKAYFVKRFTKNNFVTRVTKLPEGRLHER